MTCPPNALADGVDLRGPRAGRRVVGHLDAGLDGGLTCAVARALALPGEVAAGRAAGRGGDRRRTASPATGSGRCSTATPASGSPPAGCPSCCSARPGCAPDGGVEVVLPDGTVTDRRRRALRLARPPGGAAGGRRAAPTSAPTYETPGGRGRARPHRVAGSWEGAPGPFHDSPRIRLSLVSTGTLGTLGPAAVPRQRRPGRRGRGRAARARRRTSARCGCGSAVPIARCVMTTRPQPGGIARDTSVLKTIHRERDGAAGGAAPPSSSPGTVRTGDDARTGLTRDWSPCAPSISAPARTPSGSGSCSSSSTPSRPAPR